MLKFPVPTRPLEDESLRGYISRACDRNGHTAIDPILQLAGLAKGKMHLDMADFEVKNAAVFFGCTPDEFSRRIYSGTVDERGRRLVNVAGAPVRSDFRIETVRRVSPSSLRKSSHHRASWLLRPLLYCPESGERLISTCPNPMCRKALGWKRTNGIEYCEHCLDEDLQPLTDLRELSVEAIVGEELDTYSSISKLITNPPEVLHQVPPILADWKPWEIFDLVVIIASMVSKSVNTKSRKLHAMASDEWHKSFMLACRAVLQWPLGFYAVIDKIRSGDVHQTMTFGKPKEIGPLAYDLGRTFAAYSKEADLIRQTAAKYLLEYDLPLPRFPSAVPSAWTIRRDASRKSGAPDKWVQSLIKAGDIDVRRVSKDARRARVFLSSDQLGEILAERRELVRLNSLVAKTGLPMSTLLGLCTSKHIELADGPAARLRLPSVSSTEAARFLGRLVSAASPSVDGEAPLFRALYKLGAGCHLMKAIRECLDGRLRFSLHDGDSPILDRMMISEGQLAEIPLPSEPETINLPDKMTQADAAMFIDVGVNDLSDLIRPGRLERAAGNVHLVGGSVGKFSLKFISDRTVAALLKVHVRDVREILAMRGIRPALSYKTVSGSRAYIWRRSQLEFLTTTLNRALGLATNTKMDSGQERNTNFKGLNRLAPNRSQ